MLEPVVERNLRFWFMGKNGEDKSISRSENHMYFCSQTLNVMKWSEKILYGMRVILYSEGSHFTLVQEGVMGHLEKCTVTYTCWKLILYLECNYERVRNRGAT